MLSTNVYFDHRIDNTKHPIVPKYCLVRRKNFKLYVVHTLYFGKCCDIYYRAKTKNIEICIFKEYSKD